VTFNATTSDPSTKPESPVVDRSPLVLPVSGPDHLRIAGGVQSCERGVRCDRRHLFRWEMDARAIHLLACVLLYRGIDPQLILRTDGVFVCLDRQGSLFDAEGGAARLLAFVEPLNAWLEHWSEQVQEQIELSADEEAMVEERFGVPLERLHDVALQIALPGERQLTLSHASMEPVQLVIPPRSRLRRRRATKPQIQSADRTVVLRIQKLTQLVNSVGVICSVDSASVAADVQEGTEALLKGAHKPAITDWRAASCLSPLQ
jgi:hypothetical protein